MISLSNACGHNPIGSSLARRPPWLLVGKFPPHTRTHAHLTPQHDLQGLILSGRWVCKWDQEPNEARPSALSFREERFLLRFWARFGSGVGWGGLETDDFFPVLKASQKKERHSLRSEFAGDQARPGWLPSAACQGASRSWERERDRAFLSLISFNETMAGRKSNET